MPLHSPFLLLVYVQSIPFFLSAEKNGRHRYQEKAALKNRISIFNEHTSFQSVINHANLCKAETFTVFSFHRGNVLVSKLPKWFQIYLQLLWCIKIALGTVSMSLHERLIVDALTTHQTC